jgi:hypothetical protein
MRRDIWIGLGLLACCGLMYWQAGLAPTPPFVPFGPGFYPRVILILLAALSLWLIAESVVGRGRAAPPRPQAGAGTVRPNYPLVAGCFAVLGGYVAGLSLLGYFASTFLFVLGLSWLMGPRRGRELPKLTLVAAGTTLVTYLAFEKYLHVFLPRGLWF